jgi:alpha-L-rhamnosidase
MKSFVILMAFMGALHVQGADIKAVDLRCEHIEHALGNDAVKPRLSWKLTSDVRGQMQTAYRVCVASSASLLEEGKADVWDSGKVNSSETLEIVYAGKPALQGGNTAGCAFTL